MTTTAWRVVKQRFTETALDGEGARRFGGRWNSAGRAVVYTAATTSLALLEILVHADTTLLPHYVAIPVTFDDDLVEVVNVGGLPADWRFHPAPYALKRLGDRWAETRRSMVLQVPSAVIPHEWNYLLNPVHPGFTSLRVGKPIVLETDARLR